MDTMERHYTVNRSCEAHDVEWLYVLAFVMRYADYPADLYLIVMSTVDGVFEVAFINAVSFFGHDTAYTVTKPT